MRQKNGKDTGKRVALVAEALGVVLAYFGVFGVLMYPVLDAAGYLA